MIAVYSGVQFYQQGRQTSYQYSKYPANGINIRPLNLGYRCLAIQKTIFSSVEMLVPKEKLN